MSNLLLITDVARLRKVFGRLAEDRNIRLRVVNNLEKGGEEIAIEKPDVVFVQTHLSGLSSEILLMHLKKQLGRRRSRFVLLASPAQTNEAVLKSYQGWLDTSAEDSQLLSDLKVLLVSLMSKPKKNEDPAVSEQPVVIAKPQAVNIEESSALLDRTTVTPVGTELQLQVATTASEPSLEEQGITYAPRQRLKVYSEFNSSFDSAVSATPEPESVDNAAPSHSHDWDAEHIDTIETKPSRSNRGTFLLWLAPVIVAVVAITYLQQRSPSTPAQKAPETKAAPVVAVKPVAPASAPVPAADPAKAVVAAPVALPAALQESDKMSDKAVLNAIAENRTQKKGPIAAPAAGKLTNLPEFIPRYGFDKQFSAANPGWERYKGQVTEFKVLREAQAIKAIQVIDRGGQGVPESFMKGVLRQVAKNPNLKSETSEKKEGYEIQRGKVADNIKVVYYRDEDGGKLRAFVLTWQ